jgi:hypothetical protein
MPKTTHTASYAALIDRLRSRRHELHLTQSQVAAKVGRDRFWMHRIESCKRRADFLETLDLLRALRIKIDEAVRIVQRTQ